MMFGISAGVRGWRKMVRFQMFFELGTSDFPDRVDEAVRVGFNPKSGALVSSPHVTKASGHSSV